MTSDRGLLVACGESAIAAALVTLAGEKFPGRVIERVLLPGGCWWLAEAAAASSGRLRRIVVDRSSVVEAVSLYLRDSGLASVVLVAHQECDWYRRRFPRLGAGELVKRAGGDLYAARDEISRLAGRTLPVAGVVFVRSGDGWDTRPLF